MKILYIVNARIPSEKAHSYQIVKMCEQFALAGADLELLIPERKNSIKKDIFEFYQIKKIFKVSFIKTIDFLEYERIFGQAALYMQWLFFLLHLFRLKVDKSTLIYTRDQGVALVMGFRGYKINYENHGWFERKTKINLFMLRRAAKIITTNKFLKDSFIKNGFSRNKILVAPNGIDLNTFDLNLNKNEAIDKLSLDTKLKDKIILMYSGSFKTMGFEKGIKNILEALKILNDDNLVFMAVGGSDDDIGYYKKIAVDLGIDFQVLFFTRQSQNRLAVYQKASDILLMPFPKIAHYEFFMTPLKMFEYMAGQRPIIASDLPSIKEVLNNNNCIFCQPGDPADLADKIKQALNNPVLTEKISHQALRDVYQYSWDKRTRKILDFFA